jgi:proline iminopeptidase
VALLEGVARIRHLPCHILNGRFDVVCPPAAAWRLKQAWPEAELEIVPMAGHTSTEPAMSAALLAVMERLARRLSGSEGAAA